MTKKVFEQLLGMLSTQKPVAVEIHSTWEYRKDDWMTERLKILKQFWACKLAGVVSPIGFFSLVALTGPRPVFIYRLHSWSHWQSFCYSPNTYPGLVILPPIHALWQLLVEAHYYIVLLLTFGLSNMRRRVNMTLFQYLVQKLPVLNKDNKEQPNSKCKIGYSTIKVTTIFWIFFPINFLKLCSRKRL